MLADVTPKLNDAGEIVGAMIRMCQSSNSVESADEVDPPGDVVAEDAVMKCRLKGRDLKTQHQT